MTPRTSVLIAILLAGPMGPAPARAAQQETDADSSSGSTAVGVATMPIRVLQRVVAWIGERVDQSGIVPWVTRTRAHMARQGIRPGLSGHGRQSGTGPWLEVGHLPSDAARWWLQVGGGVTHVRYLLLEGRVGARVTEGDRPLVVEITTSMAHRPRDEFYGLRNDAPASDRADYALTSRGLTLVVAYPVRTTVVAHLGVDWSVTEIEAGRNDGLPDVGDAFIAAEAPGYGLRVPAVTTGGGVAWRSGQPFSQRREGSWLEVDYDYRFSQTDAVSSFGRVHVATGVERPIAADGGGSLFVALAWDGTHRGRNTIPLSALPTLGGAGFAAYPWDRFHGPMALLARTEVHARMWRQRADRVWVDGIVFAAHGVVGDNLFSDLDGLTVNYSYGLALGVISPSGTIGRLGGAVGRDGVRAVMGFGSTF